MYNRKETAKRFTNCHSRIIIFNTSHTTQQNYYTSGVIRNFIRIYFTFTVLTKYIRHQRYHTYARIVSYVYKLNHKFRVPLTETKLPPKALYENVSCIGLSVAELITTLSSWTPFLFWLKKHGMLNII